MRRPGCRRSWERQPKFRFNSPTWSQLSKASAFSHCCLDAEQQAANQSDGGDEAPLGEAAVGEQHEPAGANNRCNRPDDACAPT